MQKQEVPESGMQRSAMQQEAREEIEEAIVEYLIYLIEIKQLSKNTIESYKRDLYQLYHYLSELKICSLTKIKETHLDSYILKLERENKSSATVARAIVAIRKFMMYEKMNQHILINPAERLKTPKVTSKLKQETPQFISKLEVDQVFACVKGNTPIAVRDRAMLELLYGTGILVSELITLTISDVVLPYSYVKCSKKKERLIPLGRHANEALQQYILEGRKHLSEERKEDSHGDSILFFNQRGMPLTRQGVWGIVKGYGEKANLHCPLTPKILRNSFIVHMLENGADLESVSQLVGHETIAATQLYQRSNHKRMRDMYNQSHPRA